MSKVAASPDAILNKLSRIIYEAIGMAEGRAHFCCTITSWHGADKLFPCWPGFHVHATTAARHQMS